MKFDAVIFDMDGTLLDTLGDIRNALNVTMAERGLPTYSLENVRMFIGGGAKKLILNAMPEASDEERADALRSFQKNYNDKIDVETVPYPGIIDMLAKLRDAGVKVCVNSNKYDAAVQMLSKNHFNGYYFMAAGESEVYPRKPDPSAALTLAKACNAAPERTLYVGDSDIDVLTARNAGMVSAWVSWGFRTREDMGQMLPEACFDSCEELSDFIMG